MIFVGCVAQPAPRTALEAIDRIVQSAPVTRVDIAAAYVTSKGVHDLLSALKSRMGGDWDGIEKRWLTSFDYCRSEPVALDALGALPSSVVRVKNATDCLAHKGAPKTPFHPKAFFFEGPSHIYVLAGSGNLSRSGLSRGTEAGLVVGVDRVADAQTSAFQTVEALRAWFSTQWGSASALNKGLLESYAKLFASTPKLKHPVPTEDDIAPTDAGARGLTSEDLLKLRVCQRLWIESGRITQNRGKHLPGNQLMMKRLSRVFFGFDATALPQNSAIGNVDVRFDAQAWTSQSLTHSDNGMDKLTLPIPGSDGPPSYDNTTLLFTQVAPGRFTLTIGNASKRGQWEKASKAIDGAFTMSSGRKWGVF